MRQATFCIIFFFFGAIFFHSIGMAQQKNLIEINKTKQILSIEYDLKSLVEKCNQQMLSCIDEFRISLFTIEDEKKMVLKDLNNQRIANILVSNTCGVTPPSENDLCYLVNETSKTIEIQYKLSRTQITKRAKYEAELNVYLPQDRFQRVLAKQKKEESHPSYVEIDRELALEGNPNINTLIDSTGKEIPKDKIDLGQKTIKVAVGFPLRLDSGFAPPDEAKKRDEEILIKLKQLFDWLNEFNGKIDKFAKIKVKDLKSERVIESKIIGYTYLKPDNDCTTNAFQTNRAERQKHKDVIPFLCNMPFDFYLILERKFPKDAFYLEYTFSKKLSGSSKSPPKELLALNNTKKAGLIAGVKDFELESDEIDTTLGLREPETNLDIQFNFVSAVEDDEDDEGNPFRNRGYDGTLDLRVSPFLNRFSYRIGKERLNIFRWNPIFFDAKVSTGEIEKDTLSTNRIYIGTDFSFLFKGKVNAATDDTTKAERNTYKLSFKLINASDRDFKRMEGKLNVGFTPFFARLNRPLSNRTKLVDNPLNSKKGKISIPTGNFGWQIQPVFGVELGKTYRNRREIFSNEEQTDFIRRFYTGLDMQFDLTRRFKLSLNDTLYLRGESEGRTVWNYFKGTFETALGRLGRGGGQSAFVSYERGFEPPFVGSGVNAFKVGYRIQFNFGRDGVIY